MQGVALSSAALLSPGSLSKMQTGPIPDPEQSIELELAF